MAATRVSAQVFGRVFGRVFATAPAIVLALALSACGTGLPVKYEYPTSGPGGKPTYEKQESLLGDDGFELFSLGEPSDPGQGSGIAVNAFLWRASLDTLAFMPLASADPFGGVIITDWYTAPETPNERFKITVYILDRALRSDGIRANVFRQEKAGASQWIDARVEESLGKDLEDVILTRARQIRIQQTSNQ